MGQTPNPGFICPPAPGELVADAEHRVLDNCPKCGGRMQNHMVADATAGFPGTQYPMRREQHTAVFCGNLACNWHTCFECRLQVNTDTGRVRPLGRWVWKDRNDRVLN